MDWSVGDLAVCVDAGPCRTPQLLRNAYRQCPLEVGRSYRVIGFGLANPRAGPETYSLIVDGARAADEELGFGFALHRFRKIRPDEHEACEPEFVTLIRKSRNRVSA